MTTTHTSNGYNLMMLSGDSSVARGIDGAFSQMLAHFSAYWQRIDILTPTAPDAQPQQLYDNVFVHPSPHHRLMQPIFIRRKGAGLMRERPYHLVTSHDFGFFYNGIGAYWLLRQRSIPYVSEIHHIEGHPHAVTRREQAWRFAARQYIPFAARHAAAFRVVNASVKQTLQEWGGAEQKICLLHSLYIDYEIFKPIALEKRYDVLFVGRLASNKGIMLLLEAVRQLRQTRPMIRVALRGDGPLRTEVEATIAAHEMQQHVVLLPRLPDNSALARLYNQSRMLVCASTVEGNPRVTVEAMACGIPVITTPVGIMPEIMTHDQSGLFFEGDSATLAQHMDDLLTQPDKAQAIGQQGQEAASAFDVKSIVERYATAYHRLIENGICDTP